MRQNKKKDKDTKKKNGHMKNGSRCCTHSQQAQNTHGRQKLGLARAASPQDL